ncbi:MAG: hypothetical protein QNJ60_06040 [Xenococcaceae cyanobacterium MO_188.B19]|nr:hypothetical protein [Xenococcaceae cyanobacterium MO_188.B19]
MITYTPTQTKITEKTIATCAACPKFKDFNEGRGRGLCTVFDRIVFSHHPFTNDCRLNLVSKTIAKDKSIDVVGKEIQETRLRLDKSKRCCSVKNQLILKAPF